jgi:CHRD domain-containing protein
MTTRSICFILMIGALASLVPGCVDTPSGGQAVPDYHALARIVDATADQSGGAVTIDGNQVANLSFGASSSYLDILAGGRDMGFGSTVQHVNFRSNSQNTVLLYSTSTSPRFLAVEEGYSFKNNGGGDPSLAQVKFVHVATGSAPTISFFDSSASGTPLAADVGYPTSGGYVNLTAGAHQVYAVSNGGYLALITGSQVVPTPVSTNTNGTGSLDLTIADSASYTVTMHCDPHDSLYTAAHFHVGLPSVNGPVIQPIDVSGQVISFPDVTLDGVSESTPDPSVTATGVGTFSFGRDGLTYSITVTPSGLDSPFVAGHFHRGAPGVAGPIVRNITTTPVGDTTLSGVWASTDLVQPLTPALITDLLAGDIYVNFHSATHPGGAIRGQLVPDTLSTNVFSGVWNGVTDAIKDTIVSGNIYINFHSTRYPASIVRGQLYVDSTRGQYGVASLPAAEYGGARMYTVVASGSGKALNLLQFSDRQAGVAKVSPATAPVKK